VTRRFEDVPDRGSRPWAIAALALWLSGLFSARLRANGWLAGGATLALLLAPVLGLRNHTYHYYLYAPLIGAAWCAAALADAWFRPRSAGAEKASRPATVTAAGPGEALAWPIALLVGACFVLNGLFLVRKIESMPFVDVRLRADTTVDRARIARQVHDGLATAELPVGARLLFWSPASMRFERQLHPQADVIGRETYWERNVRAALQDGLGVRVMFPQVDSVEFLHAYRPAEANRRFVLYDIDGTVQVETPARVDSLLRQAAAGR
jgi:hypothetical protein